MKTAIRIEVTLLQDGGVIFVLNSYGVILEMKANEFFANQATQVYSQ